MAKQSARRDRKNQGFSPCFISTPRVMWFRSANSHTGPQHKTLHQEAGQMAASDYVPNLSKYRLHPKGRPQMGSGRSGFGNEYGEGRRFHTHTVMPEIDPKVDVRPVPQLGDRQRF